MKNLMRLFVVVVLLFGFVIGGISYLLLSYEGELPAFFPSDRVDVAYATALDESDLNESFQADPTPTADTEQKSVKVFVSGDLPKDFINSVQLNEGTEYITSAEQADIAFYISDQAQIGTWTYALALPFNNLNTDTTFSDFYTYWQSATSIGLFYRPILMTEDTALTMMAWLGLPAAGSIEIVDQAEILNRAWNTIDQVALIPLDTVSPKWKVLYIDGIHPLHNDYDQNAYKLAMPISMSGELSKDAVEQGLISFVAQNFDRSKMTNVMLTGVTALVRATAYTMEKEGVLHPSEEIGEFMRSMDVTHISNEVPFAEGCPYPDPVQQGLVFCSDVKYYDLLDSVGMDVMELTGDHFNDWGSEAMMYTLQIYNEHGIPYYGGGENLADGMKPYTFENHGNKIAFIGCNGKGLDTATETYPGAVGCDYDYLNEEVAKLKSEGYVVIFTSQHNEIYQFEPSYELMRDFRFVHEAGADIVSGSQAHVPHGVELFDDSIITYGLGNLFFDQFTTYEWGGEAVLAVHTIYNNEYIHTELVPIVFVDYAKPIFASQNEGRVLLENMFNASYWR